MPDDNLQIELVYAFPDAVFRRHLSLPAGSLVADAIRASGLEQSFPELAGASLQVGIYSRRVKPDTPLRDGDRVEVYRPLRLDPKEARRRRATKSA